jgi:polysaccharide pyruvyl transferase WcaK-like protein
MKALVFNDTSRFHLGSAAVVRQLLHELDSAGVQVLATVYGNSWSFDDAAPSWRAEDWDAADLIVINGEGTLHDDARMAVLLLEQVAALAKAQGKRVALVNALWERMSGHLAEIAHGLDLITVREPASFAALGCGKARMMPDLSYYDIPPYSRLPRKA